MGAPPSSARAVSCDHDEHIPADPWQECRGMAGSGGSRSYFAGAFIASSEALRIVSASALSPQPITFTHLPSSRSL